MNASHTLKLLPVETKSMIWAPSITIITFFHGPCLFDDLRRRFAQIVTANPWLLSKLTKSQDGEIVAVYPSVIPSSLDEYFQVVDKSSLSSGMPYDSLVQEVGDARLPSGITSVDKDFYAFKVTLINIKPNEQFALVLSMCHAIGDGHTLYSIYTMFDYKAQIRSLKCEREMAFFTLLTDKIGVESELWLASAAFGQGMYQITVSSPTVGRLYTLNKDEITRIKAEHKATSASSDDFISTNDIVTSWFCILCNNSTGLIATNFRNRIEGITEDMAGNYFTFTVCDKERHSTPENIRKSFTTFNNGIVLPSDEETLTFNIANITNWCSFYRDIQLNGDSNQVVSHFPLYDVKETGFKDTCIVFNLNSDTVAVMLMTRTPIDIDTKLECKDSSVSILDRRIF